MVVQCVLQIESAASLKYLWFIKYLQVILGSAARVSCNIACKGNLLLENWKTPVFSHMSAVLRTEKKSVELDSNSS